MPEPTFKDLCDELRRADPSLTRSKAKRAVAAYVAEARRYSLAELVQRGYFLMHRDPTGERATN
jgi:hypothetical protein